MHALDPLHPHLAQGLQFSLPAALMIVFIIVSVLMILIVLIQRPQGGGLSGAFGAAADGAGQTAFGAKTGDALTLATVATFVIFLLTAVGLNFALRPEVVDPAQPTASTTEPDNESPASGSPFTVSTEEGGEVEMQQLSPDDLGALFGGEGDTDDQGAPPDGEQPTTTPDEPSSDAEPQADPAGG